MKKTPKTISGLEAAAYNPRTIDDIGLEGLAYSIKEFGDLSGIVFNTRFGNLVAGHQRVKALTLQYGNLKIKDGQITTPDGEVFSVRLVDWDLQKEKAACIAANSPAIQGQFTTGLTLLLDEIQATDMPIFEKLMMDELYAVPITFEVADAFGPDDMRGSFSGNLSEHSPYSSITILIPKEEVETIKVAQKQLGREDFSARIIQMCRGINA